jgi:hypothetical protein
LEKHRHHFYRRGARLHRADDHRIHQSPPKAGSRNRETHNRTTTFLIPHRATLPNYAQSLTPTANDDAATASYVIAYTDKDLDGYPYGAHVAALVAELAAARMPVRNVWHVTSSYWAEFGADEQNPLARITPSLTLGVQDEFRAFGTADANEHGVVPRPFLFRQDGVPVLDFALQDLRFACTAEPFLAGRHEGGVHFEHDIQDGFFRWNGQRAAGSPQLDFKGCVRGCVRCAGGRRCGGKEFRMEGVCT